MEEIGFIGLGKMGVPIAHNLLKAGYALRVYNRSPEKARELVALGARQVYTPGETATPGGVVLSIVADDAALNGVVTAQDAQLARKLAPAGVHVSLSTVAPQTSANISRIHQQHGSTLVAAPVFGRPPAAAAAELVVCMAGPAAARQRVQSILRALGPHIFEYGDDPQVANVVKLTGNFLITAAIEALGEGLALAAKHGIDPVELARMFTQTMFACSVYRNYATIISERQYTPPGFALVLGLKDLNLILQTGAAARAPLPLASLLRDRYLAALAKGRDDLDWSAIALNAAEDAGLK
jgi:3-hydroxyisobutyrate dehydrogenase-like beta-hydroxyacid dehydrogenase